MPTQRKSDPQVLIVRVFRAPRDQVFRAWSSADSLRRWFAPNGCELSHCEIDFRPGGSLRTCIRTPDGQECWVSGRYHEIVPPARLVFTMGLTDSVGRPATSETVGKDPDWPAETVVTVTFDDLGGSTRLTLHQNVSEKLAKKTGAHPSWLQMFDRLAAALESN